MTQTKARWELESHSLMVINKAPNTHPPKSVKKKKKRSDRNLGPLPFQSVTASLTVLIPGLGILPLPLQIVESTTAHCFFKGHFHLSVRRTIRGVKKFHLTITRILSQDRHMNYWIHLAVESKNLLPCYKEIWLIQNVFIRYYKNVQV